MHREKSVGRTARTAWRPSPGEAGVTGLETAIVLIAFVVVASVFAYAILTTGLLTTESSRAAITSGIEETRSTIQLRGSVAALSNATTSAVASVRFQLANASGAGAAVSLETGTAAGATVVTYTDGSTLTSTLPWTATWITGAGPMLEPDEIVEIAVDVSSLDPVLGPSRIFTIEVKPPRGPTLRVERKTPPALAPVMDLN